jgi:ubiquinone/menaquinone biosynthesis C-methylase UbiE
MSAGNYEATADIYAAVGIEDTYYLAYRAAADVLRNWRYSAQALDHGCGTGRSTRFLRDWGFRCVGVDVSEAMLRQARRYDSTGQYVQVGFDALPFGDCCFDLIFQSFVLVEIREQAKIIRCLSEFRRILKPSGILVIVTPSEEYYTHEWKSFVPLTNLGAPLPGAAVPVSLRGTSVVFYDSYWTHSDYESMFRAAGLTIRRHLSAKAHGTEPFRWYSELEHSCWSVYVAGSAPP